jgi:hypothetical protein
VNDVWCLVHCPRHLLIRHKHCYNADPAKARTGA